MKFGICIPSTGYWLEPFAKCLIELLEQIREDGDTYQIFSRKSSLLPKNRRQLAEDALGAACDYVLYLDSDMTFPRILTQSWGKYGHPIIAANCTQKRKNIHDKPRFTAQLRNLESIQTDTQIHGQEQVFRVGTGIMMIRADVFSQIKKPWFMIGWNPETNSELGEDYFFCQRARDAAIPIYIDHDMSRLCGHVGYYQTTWEDAIG